MSDHEKFLEEQKTCDLRTVESPSAPAVAESTKTTMGCPGKFTQYFHNGPGYAFMPTTVKSIPSGVYKIDRLNNMATLIPIQVQSDTILRLPDSRPDELVAEIEHFWTLKKQFKDGNDKAHGGFIHKRGYMLFGPPGSGKTSVARW